MHRAYASVEVKACERATREDGTTTAARIKGSAVFRRPKVAKVQRCRRVVP